MFNILVVEDDKNLQKMMTAVLRENGYNIITAKSGLEVIKILDTCYVDLIISDMMIPNMNDYPVSIVKPIDLDGMVLRGRNIL